MRHRPPRAIAAILVLVVCVLHNEEWLFHRDGGHLLFDPMDAVFGWLPMDIVYHLAWVAIGCATAWLVLRVTWRHDS